MFALIFIGLIFLILGVAIGKYKCYWLISGYNTASKENKAKMDIESIGKAMAKMSYIVGGVNLIGAFLMVFFKIPIIIFVFLTLAIIFYFVWNMQKYDHSSNSKAGKVILVVVMVIVLAVNIPIFTLSYKSTDVEITTDYLKVNGMYKQSIHRTNITEIKLLDNMPEIKLRTNGIGLGKIQKGRFKLEGIQSCYLFLESNDGPYIQITTKVYPIFINYKDDAKTLELFNKLDKEYNKK